MCDRLHHKRRLVWMICCVLFLCVIMWQSAFGSDERVIRVGWFHQNGYQEMTEEQHPYGFNYEYLTRIAQYNGWKYQFVEANSFSDCYDMLQKGKIDLMGYVLHTEERENQVAFPEQNCGYSTTSLFVKTDSPIAPYDFDAFNGIKVACMKSQNPVYLQEYAEKNHFSPKLVYYANNQAIEQAVWEGKVDAGLIAGYQCTGKTRIVATFQPKPFYFVVQKSDQQSLNELNHALNQLRIEAPFFDRDLSYKYLPEVRNTLHLTGAEKAYMKANPVIPVTYDADWFPITMTDPITGGFSGIAADVFERISAMTGLQFTYHPMAKSWVKKQEFRVLAGTVQNIADAYESGYRVTSSYLEVPLSIVKRTGMKAENVKTTALPKMLAESVDGQCVEGTEWICLPGMEDCLEAVKRGKADQALINVFASEYYLKQNEYKSLRSTLLYSESYPICVAVNEKEDPALCSILNKALGIILVSDINAMVYKNTYQPLEINWRSIVSQMPSDVVLLLAVILLVILTLSLIGLNRQTRYAQRIRTLLYTDELTGSLSYQGFELEVPQKILDGDYDKAYIVDFDINHFGDYNSLNGYQKGNELLCIVAKISNEWNPEQEICARVQADHFVSLRFGHTVEEMVERCITGMQLFREKTGSDSLLISYGIYEIEDPTLSITTMCDRALTAKRTVKGNYDHYVAVYDKELHQKQLHDMDILNSFEKALHDGEFVHYYQPKCDSWTKKMVGAEALARWVQKSGEVVSPAEFIQLLESNGLIGRLDLHLFEQLCKKIAYALQKGEPMVPISVNFSRVHLFDSEFAKRLQRMIEQYDVPASLIEIEITETAFADGSNAMIQTINQLHKVGFLVSMDDFGSGFSSLISLKDANFDIVKLDRGFLNSVGQTVRGEKVIANIISLAHDLQLRIVGEGVETETQYELLKNCGCEMLQGFYFSKPLAAEEFGRLLEGDFYEKE